MKMGVYIVNEAALSFLLVSEEYLKKHVTAHGSKGKMGQNKVTTEQCFLPTGGDL